MADTFSYEGIFASNVPTQPRRPTPRAKYDFGTAFPNPDTVPIEGLWQGLREALNREGRDLALYPHIQGHLKLREFVASKLKRDRGINATPEEIVIGNGSSHVIALLLDLLINPGDIVLTEDFFYLGTLSQLRRFKADVIGIPTDEEGMNTQELEKTLKQLTAQGKRPKLIYTISAYQNPLGMNLSAARRKRMLELAQEYRVPIMEDECYVDLRFEGDMPPAMRAADESGSAIYVGSFSKIVAPGVRLGYAVLPEEVMGRFLAIRMDGGPNQLASLAVLEYMQHHMDEHIEEVNLALKVKRDAMLSALGENFPPTCQWSRPQGSLYIWLQLPQAADATALQEKAMESDVRYLGGSFFSPTGDGSNCMRLCYGYNTPEEIREGIAILARVFEEAGALDERR